MANTGVYPKVENPKSQAVDSVGLRDRWAELLRSWSAALQRIAEEVESGEVSVALGSAGEISLDAKSGNWRVDLDLIFANTRVKN